MLELDGSALFVKIMKRKARCSTSLPKHSKAMKIQASPRDLTYESDIRMLTSHRSSIKRDATGDHYNSYILEQMLSTYRNCALESGPGMKRRMHDIMSTQMRHGNIFINIRRRIKETSKLFDETASNLKQQLGEVCEQIGNDLAVLRGSATVMEEHPEFWI
jgi:hypothetical protein